MVEGRNDAFNDASRSLTIATLLLLWGYAFEFDCLSPATGSLKNSTQVVKLSVDSIWKSITMHGRVIHTCTKTLTNYFLLCGWLSHFAIILSGTDWIMNVAP